MDEREAEGTGADETDLSEVQQRAACAEVSDRSLQIRIAGVLQLLIGLSSTALAVIMIAFGGAALQSSGQAAAGGMSIVVVVYSVVALFFIITGIEAIRLRRWVRPVILSIMWPVIIFGIMMLILLIFMIPAMKSSIESSGATGPVTVLFPSCVCAVPAILFILLPLSLAGLYHGEHVRRYLEYRNPAPSWTDAAPIPVFGLSLWLFLFALNSLAVLLVSKIPYGLLFGKMITGPLLIVYFLVQVLVGFSLAYGLYRLKPWAWWSTLIASLIFFSAYIVNALFPPSADVLSCASGLPQEQAVSNVAMLQSLRPPAIFVTVLLAILFTGYLIYIRRFFVIQNAKP
ncbi:MAG: hypothetical protein AB9903_34165 [Vulcanimicrobiota bacterium]